MTSHIWTRKFYDSAIIKVYHDFVTQYCERVRSCRRVYELQCGTCKLQRPTRSLQTPEKTEKEKIDPKAGKKEKEKKRYFRTADPRSPSFPVKTLEK